MLALTPPFSNSPPHASRMFPACANVSQSRAIPNLLEREQVALAAAGGDLDFAHEIDVALAVAAERDDGTPRAVGEIEQA
jgi:predicted dinucleotide-utilizing enzyme